MAARGRRSTVTPKTCATRIALVRGPIIPATASQSGLSDATSTSATLILTLWAEAIRTMVDMLIPVIMMSSPSLTRVLSRRSQDVRTDREVTAEKVEAKGREGRSSEAVSCGRGEAATKGG